MTRKPPFHEWIDRHPTPHWRTLPLTHITRAVFAERMLDDGRIDTERCEYFDDQPLAFFFYGRPAYRANRDKLIQLEASCPCCFVFDPQLLRRAHKVYAFDTGAFSSRMYNHVLDEGFQISDFEIGRDPERLSRLVQAAFNSQQAYFDADRSALADPETGAEAWELQGRSYLSLLRSPGKNEPDDRICTIEAVFADPVLLSSDLLAIVVPHTFWNVDKKSPHLKRYGDSGVEIRTYKFIPGRTPEYYQTHLESEIERYYKEKSYL